MGMMDAMISDRVSHSEARLGLAESESVVRQQRPGGDDSGKLEPSRRTGSVTVKLENADFCKLKLAAAAAAAGPAPPGGRGGMGAAAGWPARRRTVTPGPAGARGG
jgi:hypothetical protein